MIVPEIKRQLGHALGQRQKDVWLEPLHLRVPDPQNQLGALYGGKGICGDVVEIVPSDGELAQLLGKTVVKLVCELVLEHLDLGDTER